MIRLLMAQAASNAGKDLREWGFTHTVQLWTEWGVRGLSAAHDGGRLFDVIAQTRSAIDPGASRRACEKDGQYPSRG
jgi:hypothetical protein